MIHAIADWVPPDAEAGVGLAIQGDDGRYLFFLAGTRHYCPPGERFYAGIGGHLEPGEDWLACARREAREEVGSDIEILAAPETWYVSRHGAACTVQLIDRPRPLALYEMIHPPGTPRAGELYRIVVYRARLCSLPTNLPEDEVLAILALTRDQVIQGPERKPTLAALVAEGARIVASGAALDPDVRLYPLGTARALAHILSPLPSGRTE
jgi:8-oxo-dGTP pyrophosphatase MutT (NUDIX family)